ncbi:MULTISPECIES: DUF1816 domain-containing protein [unclassified Coleofasciculus]|uniref:DUF1816 domain-containing protein n=1 Tax=unclassified Coleofasciculus TaxID=2692782 RepID=UPI00187DE03A|nr:MULTISPECIES: DUF1816 domain-containing protein [unclassified Coleofasciculus]MBE9127112.1 DUF1816 domain-containing protein [Coleofasciculus sp. LEGE 07081]MBE9150435.1 DUF1816 domain-containing protein [Coleofasciculus sp. LEGE 07092]
MDISNTAGSVDNIVSANRWFLYEVVGLRQNGETSRLGYPIRRSSSVFIKVPYSRMGHVMRRITHMGGKIISIQALTTDSQTSSTLAWWVEISTTQPEVLYYFGPFDSVEEATSSQRGYIKDLQQENAQGITVKIKWCQQPENLTVF